MQNWISLTFLTTRKEKGIQLITDFSWSWIYSAERMICLERYATAKVAPTVGDGRQRQSGGDSYEFSVRWFPGCFILGSLLPSEAGACCSSAGSGICIHERPCHLMFWLSQKEKRRSRTGGPKFILFMYCRFGNLPSREAVDRAKSEM